MKLSKHRIAKLASDSQAGHALLLSAILGTLALALWLVAFRSTNDAIGFQLGEQSRAFQTEALPSAMAKAGRLLRTGEPPRIPYVCIYKHYVEPGVWDMIALEFARGGGQRRWSVEARRATPSEIRRYPALPDNF